MHHPQWHTADSCAGVGNGTPSANSLPETHVVCIDTAAPSDIVSKGDSSNSLPPRGTGTRSRTKVVICTFIALVALILAALVGLFAYYYSNELKISDKEKVNALLFWREFGFVKEDMHSGKPINLYKFYESVQENPTLPTSPSTGHAIQVLPNCEAIKSLVTYRNPFRPGRFDFSDYYKYIMSDAIAKDIAQSRGNIRSSIFAPHVKEYTGTDAILATGVYAKLELIVTVYTTTPESSNAFTKAIYLFCMSKNMSFVYGHYHDAANTKLYFKAHIKSGDLVNFFPRHYAYVDQDRLRGDPITFATKFLVEMAFAMHHASSINVSIAADLAHAFVALGFDKATGRTMRKHVTHHCDVDSTSETVPFSEFLGALIKSDDFTDKFISTLRSEYARNAATQSA